SQSTILPLPSSPHWAPITVTLAKSAAFYSRWETAAALGRGGELGKPVSAGSMPCIRVKRRATSAELVSAHPQKRQWLPRSSVSDGSILGRTGIPARHSDRDPVASRGVRQCRAPPTLRIVRSRLGPTDGPLRCGSSLSATDPA